MWISDQKRKRNGRFFDRVLWKFYPIDKNIQSRRMIFCVNPGRSGSKYLANVLNTASEVSAYHEASPVMGGKYIYMINNFPYNISKKERALKPKAIIKLLKKMPETSVYAETNHLFIHTFYDVILDNCKNVQLVWLERDPGLVLKSFLELGYFSDKNTNWPFWFPSPNAVTAAKPSYCSLSDMNHSERCIAYLADFYARATRLASEYPENEIFHITIDELNSSDHVKPLFDKLEITPTKETVQQTGNKLNSKNDSRGSYISLEYCWEQIRRFDEMRYDSGLKPRY